MTERRMGENDKEIIQARIEQHIKDNLPMISNWEETVIKLKAIPKEIFENQKDTNQEKACYVAGWDDGTAAQAKRTGELADFIIALVISLAQKKERERIRPYCEDTIEILTNAQEGWGVVTKTYAPEWTHPLKEVIDFMEVALRGKGSDDCWC